MTFASWLRDIRGARLQREVAEKIGVAQSKWSSWENGHPPLPTFGQLHTIFVALDADFAQREIGEALWKVASIAEPSP